MYTSVYQAGNDCFCFKKEEETRPDACGVFTQQGPSTESLHQSRTWEVLYLSSFNQRMEVRTSYPLDYPLLQHLLFSFLDPAKAAENARLRSWTGNLLIKHGLRPRKQTE